MSRPTLDPVIADIMALLDRYDEPDLVHAESLVRSQFAREADLQFALATILGALRFTRRKRLRGQKRAVEKPAAAAPGRRRRPTPEDVPADTLIRELRAILADQTFLSSEQALTEFLQRYFRDLMPPHAKGDPREEVLAQFQRIPAEQQRSIFQAARAAYLKSRGSSLPGWSDLIRGEDK